MKQTSTVASVMPDIANQPDPHLDGVLEWVGMRGVVAPVNFDAGDGEPRRSSARVDAFVNLMDAEARGIHMSRLYLLLDHQLGARPISAAMLESLLHAFLESHKGLSNAARIHLGFEHLMRRPAMLSAHGGWRAYPITIDAQLDADGFRLELGTEIVYSSTCPASAALSRQLIQRQFASDFDATQPVSHAAVLAWLGSDQGIVATPHAQRSVARVRVRYAEAAALNAATLIDEIEAALGTPVQTAVKREDEQAFALANGRNPMFCEDAARRIQRALDADANIADFHLCVEHQESLHAHDAVAYASKHGSTATQRP